MTAAVSRTLPLEEALAQAVAHHQAGRLQEAEGLYRAILQAQPAHPDANHNLGVLAMQLGQCAAGLPYLKSALSAAPGNGQYWLSYADALQALGQLDEAVASYRQALALKPDYAEACNNLGVALQAQGQLDEAVESYRRVLAIRPEFAEAHCNLGNALQAQGKLDEAAASYRRAFALKPDYAVAHYNLGVVLQAQGQFEEAVASYRQALAIKPDFAQAHGDLGNALQAQGEFDDAVASYRRALAIKPDYAEVHNNLGTALQTLGRLDEAITSYRRALAINSDYVEAHRNLGNTLKELGMHGEAVASYRKALTLAPDDEKTYSAMLVLMNFVEGIAPDAKFADHLGYAAQFERAAGRRITHENECDYRRRLRLGYLSFDFGNSILQYYLQPLFAGHDKDAFELFMYDNASRETDTTQVLKRYANTWRCIAGASDTQVADLIRTDEIDILVDLSGHLTNNRLLTFALKPAPVQMTWLGYQNTTGLRSMDYRITDSYCDPPGVTERYYTEKLLRLPESSWCYCPPCAIQPTPLPALTNGYITFGCLNLFMKITQGALQLWAEILRHVKESRLTLIGVPSGEATVRVKCIFARAGVTANRLSFLPRMPEAEYRNAYRQVDIALDPFPYNGLSTTLDALWMGVPVVTLAGNTYAARCGVSVLSTVGLSEFIAADSSRYFDIARTLAENLARLDAIRQSLPHRISHSSLADGPRFAQNMESLYREAWRHWCESRNA